MSLSLSRVSLYRMTKLYRLFDNKTFRCLQVWHPRCRLSAHKRTFVYFKASQSTQSRIPTLTREPDDAGKTEGGHPKTSFPGRNGNTLLEGPFWSSPVAFLKHKNTADWTGRTRDSAYNIKCTLNELLQIIMVQSPEEARRKPGGSPAVTSKLQLTVYIWQWEVKCK